MPVTIVKTKCYKNNCLFFLFTGTCVLTVGKLINNAEFKYGAWIKSRINSFTAKCCCQISQHFGKLAGHQREIEFKYLVGIFRHGY